MNSGSQCSSGLALVGIVTGAMFVARGVRWSGHSGRNHSPAEEGLRQTSA